MGGMQEACIWPAGCTLFVGNVSIILSSCQVDTSYREQTTITLSLIFPSAVCDIQRTLESQRTEQNCRGGYESKDNIFSLL